MEVDNRQKFQVKKKEEGGGLLPSSSWKKVQGWMADGAVKKQDLST